MLSTREVQSEQLQMFTGKLETSTHGIILALQIPRWEGTSTRAVCETFCTPKSVHNFVHNFMLLEIVDELDVLLAPKCSRQISNASNLKSAPPDREGICNGMMRMRLERLSNDSPISTYCHFPDCLARNRIGVQHEAVDEGASDLVHV